MKITTREGHWDCAEIVSRESFGYGTYRFWLESTVDDLDSRVVLGMFTWSDAADYNHREIDIEISRWGRAVNKNAQVVIQPYSRSKNIARFQIPSGLGTSTHMFSWGPTSVFCQSLKGFNTVAGDTSSVIQQHTFTEGVPVAGGENARVNLWLFGGQPPTDGNNTEIIISKFEFRPMN
jgi:hypothetical protein